MEWGKLFANLPDIPRVQRAAADGAGWLLIESMCYCTSAETKGFIPHTQIERFGGGPRKRQKIDALVRERIWQPVELGYLLDPDLWNEERNLSDSAEKKKEKDRNRIAEKRALQREQAEQDGQVSRDSSATCRATPDATKDATCRSDSRTLDQKRTEEIPTADVVSHPKVADAHPRDDDDHELIAATVGAFLERTEHMLADDDARAVAAKVLARASHSGAIVHRPARYVAAAVASEPDPFTLLDEPPPLREILADFAPAKPAPCGLCDPRTRMREDPVTGRPYRCPECNPNAQEAS